MPYTPFAFSISLSALRHIQASRGSLAVTQSAETSPSEVPRHTQMLELDPVAVEIDLDIVFRANDEGNSQFIEQIEEFDIGKGSISRYQQAASSDRCKHLRNERADEVSLIAAAVTFKRILLVCPPVERYCARTRAKRSNQEMLLIFNGPIDAETNCAEQWELTNDDASGLEREAIYIETRIMQKAIETFAGSLKVIEETSQASLTATSGCDQRKHKIYESVALMAMCIVKDQVDILNKAGGSRVLSVHNPILYRVYNSIPLAE